MNTGFAQGNEVFYLYEPNTSNLLYTSPVVPNNSSATRTVCIPKTTYDTYDLKFSSPAWHYNSNVFFKGSYNQHLYASP